MSKVIFAITAVLFFAVSGCSQSVGVTPDPVELVDIDRVREVDPPHDCRISFLNVGEWPVEIIAMHFFLEYNPNTQDPDVPVGLLPEDPSCHMFYDGRTAVLSCGLDVIARVQPGDEFIFNADMTGNIVTARLMYVVMDVPDDENEPVQVYTDLAEEQILCASNAAP